MAGAYRALNEMGAYVEELEAELDQLKKDMDRLLEAVAAHEAERAHGLTSNMDYADDCLYRVGQELKEKRYG